MLYWLLIEYKEDDITKYIEKFFNSAKEREKFLDNFKKRRK